MFEYFYHEIIRKTVIGFGTLFNDIVVKKVNENNQVTSSIKVPLAYGPMQKFLARIEQQPNLNKPIQMTLPRMSFELVGLTYDPRRKSTTTQTFLTKSLGDPSQIKKVFLPVPYDIDFELSIMCKLNDDMLQIIEQILPYFQPSYTLTVNLVESIGEKRDIPITLNSIFMKDDYEGNFDTRRALVYTLRFTAKTYLFAPVSGDANKDIIKKSTIGFIAGDSNSTTRDLRYSVEPVATKNYTGSSSALVSSDVAISDTIITVNDTSNIPENSYITLNDETLYVTKKVDNTLTVTRGSYNTGISEHVSGTEVYLITQEDNALIELGDDFGFSGLTYS